MAQWIEKANRYTSRPDRVRMDDGGTDLADYAHARIDAWLQRGQPVGPSEYPVVVALLRAVYDIVDRLKTWEEERGLNGSARFAQLCREFDAAYAARPARPGAPADTARQTLAVDAPRPATAQQADDIGRRVSALREAADDTRRRLEGELVQVRRQQEEALAQVRHQQEEALAQARHQQGEALAQAQQHHEAERAEARHRLETANRRALATANELAASERRLQAIETSTVWRATAPLRLVAHRFPGPRRVLSRALRLLYWTATLQLGARLRSGGRAGLPADLGEIRHALGVAVTPPAASIDPAGITIFASEAPVVSVIIPTYGQVDFTLRCLRSIAEALPDTPIEVIVAEDASGDPDIAFLRQVRGICLIENSGNLGFLRSCNAAAKTARGRHLLFLNNDTEVLPGAIEALARTLDDHPEAGLAGARLVYPDGRLQEAGGIVWNDGSAWNYGRFDDPRKPEYNYLRETDYCSGAAILVPADLFAELGGFDDIFAPAYYEDTDLAFRIRRHGRKVLYQPRAVVVHHEGISYGTDTKSGGKAYQVRNQALFLERWGEQLRREQFENGTNVLRARDRARGRTVILMVDHYLPEPDRDAGSRTMQHCIRIFLEAGWVVKFWPENRAATPKYAEALQAMGVEILCGPSVGNFDDWMTVNGQALDYALLSRPTVASAFLTKVRAFSRAAIVYYGHDLHFARLRQQAEVTGNRAALAEADQMERAERRAWRDADLSLYLSDEERDVVAALAPDAAVGSVVPYTFSHFADRASPPPGAEILFVAGFAHPPNVDAAAWFVRDVLPLIRARRADVRVVLAGSNPSPKVRELAGQGLEVTGFLSDAELAMRYASARVAVVPLRFGAGVKLKVVEALREGLPLVTTPVGVQGLTGLADIIAVHDQPEAFAAAVLALLDDDAAWVRQSRAQTAYARQRFSEAAMRDGLLEAFREASERRHGLPA